MIQIKQTISAEETAVTSVMGDSVNALSPQVTILLWLLSSTDKMPLKTILIAILPAFIRAILNYLSQKKWMKNKENLDGGAYQQY